MTQSDLKILIILYGNIDFDGRVKRMIEIGQSLGQVYLLDATEVSQEMESSYQHSRVQLNPAWGKVRRHLIFWWQTIVMARRSNPDIVFAEDFFATMPGWLAAKICSAKLVYDAHELIVPEPGTPISLRNKVWYILERFVAPRADLVIAANIERAEIMAEHYRFKRPPTYMRNIPSQREVTSLQREVALNTYPQLRKQNKKERILLYQGDVSLARGLSRFVEVLDHLPENYRLIIAGEGADLDCLTKQAGHHTQTGRFVALGRVPNTMLPAVTVHGDIGIVTYPRRGLNNIYCAPNKVFEYAQAGLPVITSDQPPLRTLFEGIKSSQTFSESDDLAALAGYIMQIETQRETLERDIEQLLAQNNSNAEYVRVINRMNKL